jgi:hypothetical protein
MIPCQRDVQTLMFMGTLFTIGKLQKQSTEESINKWIDERNVIYSHKGILFSLYKEGNSVICDNTHGIEEYYTKWKKLGTGKYHKISLTCGIKTNQTHGSREWNDSRGWCWVEQKMEDAQGVQNLSQREDYGF